MKRNLRYIAIITFLYLFQSALQAQVVRSFTKRYYNSSLRGSIKFVSNSIVRSPSGTTQLPPTGTGANTSQVGSNIDIDTDGTTFNSSNAKLDLPSCSQVLFAGLYWGGGKGTPISVPVDTTWRIGADTCKLRLPGSATYIKIVSTQTDYANPVRYPGINFNMYQCFADITSLVTALATPTVDSFWVANVRNPSNGSNQNCFGGWSIIVVYSNPALLPQNVTVFDGCALIRPGGANALNVPINGFLTPPSPSPVSCEYGVVVLDGDRADPDSCQFRQGPPPPAPGAFYNLAQTATNPMSGNFDFMNSRITHLGANVASRRPAFTNTLGYDAHIQVLPNASNAQLGNSQTQATFRFSTSVESYTLSAVTTVISTYNPAFTFNKSTTDISGGMLTPGDSLRYRLDYSNLGNDSSTNTRIIDVIPPGSTYKPGTLRINGIIKSDAADSDEAEYSFANNRVVFRIGVNANGVTGGSVGPGVSGNVTFDVYTPSACALVSCNANLRNRAWMAYNGKISSSSLSDSSGVDVAGCSSPEDKVDPVSGVCYSLQDTILQNTCPSLSVQLPISRYAGYSIHSGIPFTPANRYNPATPVTITRVLYAYYDGPGSCDDTIRISVFITGCPDIDDDDDGLPDYLELGNPLALLDNDGDGRLNWADNTPGAPLTWVDNNVDGFSDLFDPGADADNDGIPNFYDTGFMTFTDSNADGVNDNLDKDLDGIPNHLDLDSDNDGIPDTVESFGVDANGDGKIDNYTDSDIDGLSDNVDGNTNVPGGTWLRSSGLGLGALDTDSDLVPNYLDLDSDNDGIPDIIEVYGVDAGNTAKVNVFVDTDADGYTDGLDADVGNDNVVDNSTGPLLKTGTDGNADGRTDSWPNKNMDADNRPNPYELDSDGDGILDVTEAQFTDANRDGSVDGAINANGRNSALAALPALNIPNSDGVGRANPFDIDTDEDGIPDNVEGLATIPYLLPAGADTDNDGIDNTYDSFNGFGGNGLVAVGINPVNTDGDAQPDYIDTDTDGDGLIDIIEGNDFNFNGMPDDLVTLTGIDTDGDGLDNRFDANNSSAEATSAYMGNGGTTSGDPTPGSTTVVQHTALAGSLGCPTERDWRCIFYILKCDLTEFRASLRQQTVSIDWSVYCRQEADYFIVQRSEDGLHYTNVGLVDGRAVINETESYSTTDEISGITGDFIHYRLLTVFINGKFSLSNSITVRKYSNGMTGLMLLPNPVRDKLQVIAKINSAAATEIIITDYSGKRVITDRRLLQQGSNSFIYHQTVNLPAGVYNLRLNTGKEILSSSFIIIK